jgi:hypothetical protein
LTVPNRVLVRRWPLTAVALAVTCVSLLAAAPQTAHATAQGCTGTFNVTCVLVRGSGLQVDYARAYFQWAGRPCNTQLRLSFFDTNNVMYTQYRGPLKTGCRITDEYVITPGSKFRTGRVCASLVVSGSAKSGACVSLFP